MSPGRRLLWGIGVLAAVIAVGVIGYVVIEGWSVLDALYMTIITITTVGYGETHPLSTDGRIFSMVLLLGGVGGALYTLTSIIQFVLEGEIGTIWGKRKMKNTIDRLRGHFILCGFGRVGETIAKTFHEESVPFVVIENNHESLTGLAQSGYLYIEGDATREEVLKEAGIEHARGLVVAVGSDADSTYITLSGRELRPDLFIEARASSEKVEKRLRSAGANRIVSPYTIGARRMAMLAMRPGVVDFIDTVSSRGGPDLMMENVAISNISTLVGLTVADIRQCSKATVLAVSKKDGALIPNPPGEQRLAAGDSLIIVGTNEQLSSLEGICQGVKINV